MDLIWSLPCPNSTSGSSPLSSLKFCNLTSWILVSLPLKLVIASIYYTEFPRMSYQIRNRGKIKFFH